MDEYLSEILRKYDDQYLRPQVGDGRVRQKLYKGLESLMSGSENPQTNDQTSIAGGSEPIQDLTEHENCTVRLDQPVDLVKLVSSGSANVKRLRLGFRLLNIHTYQDLINHVNNARRHNVTYVGKELTKDPFRIVGVGEFTLQCLYDGLRSVGIELFPEDKRQGQ
jgi:hypothetical protein